MFKNPCGAVLLVSAEIDVDEVPLLARLRVIRFVFNVAVLMNLGVVLELKPTRFKIRILVCSEDRSVQHTGNDVRAVNGKLTEFAGGELITRASGGGL